jgi:transcription elongation factor Elf1
MNKYCKKCNTEKSKNQFSYKSKTRGILQSVCKDCQNKYTKQHYKEKTSYYVERQKRRRKKIKQEFIEFKKTLKCSRCSEDDFVCLDFHHIDPSQKEISIATAIHNSLSMEKIKQEVDKCIVLCSNCHRKEHHRLSKINENDE